MNKISHIIISRMKFSDKLLLEKYLKITKEITIPSIKSQTNKNFVWGLIINSEDINFVHDYLNIDFITFNSINKFINYVKNNNINIQTRHDIDDYMSDDYVEKIQEIYKENIKKYNMFLIQAQPVKVDYNTKKETKMTKYTNIRNSMFLSLCQKNVVNYILERNHGQMHQITNNVITLPEGYVKWIIHGNNRSCKRNLIK